MWIGCHDLEELLPCFQGITTDITKMPIYFKLGRLEIDINPKNWDGYVDLTEQTSQRTPETHQDGSDDIVPPVFIPWDDRLTEFQKLCLIKTFKEEKVSIGLFVLLPFSIIFFL